MARSITDQSRQAQAIAAVADALTKAGQHEQAAAVARPITDQSRQAQAIAAVADALLRPASMSRPPPWPAPSPTHTARRRRSQR